MSYGPGTTLADIYESSGEKPDPDAVQAAKEKLHEEFSKAELEKLKDLADTLRRPLNRKQRRIMAARARRFGK